MARKAKKTEEPPSLFSIDSGNDLFGDFFKDEQILELEHLEEDAISTEENKAPKVDMMMLNEPLELV